MSIIADFHLHSKYSRAVSQQMNLSGISCWAAKKGINLVATGDWTHPLWFREIKNNLREVNPGIFTLKKKPKDQKKEVFFLLSTEISSIYNQEGKLRRIHHLIFSPSLETCKKIIKQLQTRGANLMADGRPIIGLTSTELLEIVLTVDKNILLIPCHVWTPWFSLYGSKSGFNSIEECFGKYSKYICAVETGLSSDPLMNWQIKELENRTIVSFSDAHSGPKLGREATVFTQNLDSKIKNSEFSYDDIIKAIKQDSSGKLKIGYTIEFFPEEGKYHWSGHRACGVRYNPREIKEKGNVCPVCQQPLTIGVEDRVIALSKKTLTANELLFIKNSSGVTFVYDKEKKRQPFVSLVPLLEILLEIYNNSPKKAQNEYERLVKFADEFEILLRTSYEEIEKQGGRSLREAIRIVRERKVFVDPGYDGVFGKVKIFSENLIKNERQKIEVEEKKQLSLF